MWMLLLGVGTGWTLIRSRDRLIDLTAGAYVAVVEIVGAASGATQRRWKRAVGDACQRRERRWARRGISGERVAAAREEGTASLERAAERIRERRKV